jgi:hypothetical protein
VDGGDAGFSVILLCLVEEPVNVRQEKFAVLAIVVLLALFFLYTHYGLD